MKTVLFLDDEPRILDVARQALAPLDTEWKVLEATNTDAAHTLLNEHRVDVLVSDVHLSGIGGIQFLSEVKARFPHTVRIACSSCAHRDMVIRGLEVAHQFISKPYEPAALARMLTGASALQDRLASHSLRELVAGITKLPGLPTLYQDLVAAMQAPNASAETASRVISKDMVLVSKLLQIVNSTYYGLRRTISSPTQAVSLLGIETVKSLVLSGKVFSELDSGTPLPLSLDALWTHSLRTAISARMLAQVEERGVMGVERAFIAGLLHDIGLLVLVSKFPDQYADVLHLAKRERLAICDAERAVFKATHADIGGYLLGTWGLNDALVEAVVFHHEPAECVHEGFSTLAAVHVANTVEEERDPALTGGTTTPEDQKYLHICGLADRLPEWRKVCAGPGETKTGIAA